MLNVSAKCFQTDELRHQYIKLYPSDENFEYQPCESSDHRTISQVSKKKTNIKLIKAKIIFLFLKNHFVK